MASRGQFMLCLLGVLVTHSTSFLMHGNNIPDQTSTMSPLGRDATLSLLVQEMLELKALVKQQEQKIQSLEINHMSDNNVTSSTVNKLMAYFLDIKVSFGTIKQEFGHLNNLTGLQTITHRLDTIAQSIRYLTLSVNGHEIKDEEANHTVYQELGHINRKLTDLQTGYDVTNRTVFQELEDFRKTLQNASVSESAAIHSLDQALNSKLSRLTSDISTLQGDLHKLNTTFYNFMKPDNIRLAGGDSSSGRVEVRFLGTWGTVCDDYFGNEDAKVVCRMLRKSWGNAVAYSEAQFGQGSGPIFYDNLGCTGTESDLFNCQHSLLGHHDCGHVEDAGVHCA